MGSFHASAGLFGPKGSTDEEKRQTVRKQRDKMLAELYKSQPKLKEGVKKAAGYAAFKQSNMNLFLLQATPAVYLPTVSGYESYDWYDCFSVTFADMGADWGSTKHQVYLDSSLFDLKTGQRIWSALTTTVLKENMDRLEKADAVEFVALDDQVHWGAIRRSRPTLGSENFTISLPFLYRFRVLFMVTQPKAVKLHRLGTDGAARVPNP